MVLGEFFQGGGGAFILRGFQESGSQSHGWPAKLHGRLLDPSGFIRGTLLKISPNRSGITRDS